MVVEFEAGSSTLDEPDTTELTFASAQFVESALASSVEAGEPKAAEPDAAEPKAAVPDAAPTAAPAASSPLELVFIAPPVLARAEFDDEPRERRRRDGRNDARGDDRFRDERVSQREDRYGQREDRSGRDERSGRGDRSERIERDSSERRGRRSEPELITEPQKVRGSTRLEAKKQRRREGRDVGRRRTIVTESEFLARRESVDRDMVVREKDGRIQIAVMEDKVLVEHYVARSQETSLIGNVYLGKVQNVLPSMEAAFVDIGRGRNAVLYSGEVDWEAAAEAGGANQPRRIELALKPGDTVLVQVTKDPIGHKGARLTSQVSLPGRYVVYVPGGSMNGISRKLPDTERARLKKILKEVLPENVGVIVRTAAEGATEDQLTRDVNRLIAQWDSIQKKLETAKAPTMLHSEPDLLVKIIRDVFNEDFQRLVIAGEEARETITEYLASVAPDLVERVQAHHGDRDIFEEFRVSEQIEKALERKVWLPSGGSLVIDRTEAMTVVDVNTGKFVGTGGNLEETVTKNNLEAAEEIVRQLRLRDIGGIVVIDFIDMVLESNRDLVQRRLIECLSRDRTKHQVAEVTSLGLVQMTRKKLGLGLLESFSEPCESCAGRGIIVFHEPVLKHRSTQSQTPSKRREKTTATNGTHAITEDAKNALAAIAASTIGHVDETKAEVTAPEAQQHSAGKPLLDLPEPVVAPIVPVADEAVEALLETVLEALPEPKAPGTSRQKRRRATRPAGLGAEGSS